MSHLNRDVRAAVHELRRVPADVSEEVGSVVHAVADNARAAAHQVRETAGRAVEAVEEKCEQVGHAARDTFEHGRHRVVRWEHDFEKVLKARPIVSLLIAAGVGVVLGALLDRRLR